MVDVNDLLRQLKQDGLSAKSFDRIRHAVGEGGLGSFGEQLRGMLSGGQSQPSATDARSPAAGSPTASERNEPLLGDRGQDMFDQAKGMLKSGDKRMIGGIGAALGVLLGGGIKGGIGGALMAILGTSAYNALKKGESDPETVLSEGGDEVPVGVRPPETPDEAELLERRALLVLKAMVAAAKADGEIDQRERERILAKLNDAGASDEIRQLVAAEQASPLDIDALVRDVPDQQTAAQIYAASLLAIEVDTAAERAYLRDLAARLGLDAQVVANLHSGLGVPMEA